MFDWQEKDIIKGCKKNKRDAQTALYEKYAPMLRGITYRYLDQAEIANDLVHDALIRILTKIKQFKGDGSFEGWMKRIMVNTVLEHFRKRKTKTVFDETYMSTVEDEKEENFYLNVLETTSQQEIVELINNLPERYRLVFNLYVFDNHTHKEIAQLLNISENTSKTQ